MLTVTETPLEGVRVLQPRVFDDPRGFFMETFNRERFAEHGLPGDFMQDNHSRSTKGVLRGLHFQSPSWQGKLVRSIAGSIFDVAVDIRDGSATYGQWFGVELSAENKKQLYVPEGFAHGFCVTSDVAEVVYKCTSRYVPQDEYSVLWNDPDIGIGWPVDNPIISEKDEKGVLLRDLKL